MDGHPSLYLPTWQTTSTSVVNQWRSQGRCFHLTTHKRNPLVLPRKNADTACTIANSITTTTTTTTTTSTVTHLPLSPS